MLPYSFYCKGLIKLAISSSISVGNNAPYSAELTKSSIPTSPGARAQFKLSTNRNLASGNLETVERNVSNFILVDRVRNE